MEYSEKLSALLTLTGVKSSELADALRLGRPYVSRMKTGARKMPSNFQIIRNIADYFAIHCGNDFILNALREYTANTGLTSYADKNALSDAIYSWLTGTANRTSTPAGRFLNNFQLFSPEGSGDIQCTSPYGESISCPPAGMSIFYNNEGKRQALRAFMTYTDNLSRPCTVRLFTDEIYDWLIEDYDFIKYMNAGLYRHVANGVTYERIYPPFNSAEFNFSSIERWLPGFMAGAIQQYYYPWARDKLHRRTLFVIPGHIALCANSVYGEHESLATILTRDPALVSLYNKEYDLIMKRCRPAMKTFTAHQAEQFFDELTLFCSADDDGICKNAGLSANTLPAAVVNRVRGLGTNAARAMADSIDRRSSLLRNLLSRHTVTDIMYIPKLTDITSGRVPIPESNMLPGGAVYYTPKEYILHLENIALLLDSCPNYRVIFDSDAQNDNAFVYIKGAVRTMLIKQSEPAVAFDITESTMAGAFCNYFACITDDAGSVAAHHAAVDRLKDELKRLSAAM